MIINHPNAHVLIKPLVGFAHSLPKMRAASGDVVSLENQLNQTRSKFNQIYNELVQMQPGSLGDLWTKRGYDAFLSGPSPIAASLFPLMKQELDLRWALVAEDETVEDALLDAIQRTKAYFVELERRNEALRIALERQARQQVQVVPTALPPAQPASQVIKKATRRRRLSSDT